MCPYCSVGPNLNLNALDKRTLSELRMTDEEYSQYRKASNQYDTYKRMIEGGSTVRVVGYNDDTKAVLKACNEKGNDFIDVPYSMVDSVVCATQHE